MTKTETMNYNNIAPRQLSTAVRFAVAFAIVAILAAICISAKRASHEAVQASLHAFAHDATTARAVAAADCQRPQQFNAAQRFDSHS